MLATDLLAYSQTSFRQTSCLNDNTDMYAAQGCLPGTFTNTDYFASVVFSMRDIALGSTATGTKT